MSWGIFFFSFFLSLGLTPMVRYLMNRFKVVDYPKKNTRKIHHRLIPLGGGLAIFFSFFLSLALVWQEGLIGEAILPTHLIGIFVASLIIMIGGTIDDRYNLPPSIQIWFPVLAAVITIAAGIRPHIISSPFGGTLSLDIGTLSFGGHVLLLADSIIFAWLMGMMFTTKFLDGLDGLVTGIVTIGAFVLFFLSTQPRWYQPEISVMSLIFIGACLGFLVWNFHPAKIFLGEGGSLLTGFLLGVLAILAGGKIATTLLIVGIPVIDTARVIFLRLRRGQPIFVGDSEHIHYKLLHNGFTHRQAVLLLYSISFLFGMTALFLQSQKQLIALSFLFVLMLLIGVAFSRRESERTQGQKT